MAESAVGPMWSNHPACSRSDCAPRLMCKIFGSDPPWTAYRDRTEPIGEVHQWRRRHPAWRIENHPGRLRYDAGSCGGL
jgi:hypothetical protein